MERVQVSLKDRGYAVAIGDGAADELIGAVKGKKALVVTDETVNGLYPDFMRGVPRFVVPAGEKSKSFETLQNLLGYMLSNAFDRNGILIAFGGGVVGDLTGFAASVYMRGISYYQVPTTLLAQVDSSVGGKTGINFSGTKNLIGSFYQSSGVYIDAQFLKTLGNCELLCGLGEIVKTAFMDGDIYDLLLREDIQKQFSRGDFSMAYELIRRCVAFKTQIVQKDEKESGLRKALNMGHTVGHAFEESRLSGDMRHGEYVLIGLHYELELAYKLGIIRKNNYMRYLDLLNRFKKDVPYIRDMSAFYDLLTRDKKNAGGKVSFMLKDDGDFCREVILDRGQTLQLLGEVNEEYKTRKSI